jgi:preprotein translocase subunit SecG
MGLFDFLIVVQGIVGAALVAVILMQRSEGGGLGMGGSPSGLMSARTAADFLTRTTTILATAFIALSISLAFVAAKKGSASSVDSSFKRVQAPIVAPAAAPAVEGVTNAVKGGTAPAAANGTTVKPVVAGKVAQTQKSGDVPLDK